MGTKKELRIRDEIAGKWKDIGRLLGCSVDLIAKNHNIGTGYYEDCCRDMLEEWLAKGATRYPVSWNSLIKVLRDIKLSRVANDIEMALDCVSL